MGNLLSFEKFGYYLGVIGVLSVGVSGLKCRVLRGVVAIFIWFKSVLRRGLVISTLLWEHGEGWLLGYYIIFLLGWQMFLCLG